MKARFLIFLAIFIVLFQGWRPGQVLCLEPSGQINLEIDFNKCCPPAPSHLSLEGHDLCLDLPAFTETKEAPFSSWGPDQVLSFNKVEDYLSEVIIPQEIHPSSYPEIFSPEDQLQQLKTVFLLL
ncbi:hypothetical protein [Thermosulfuriphilus sp.]